MKRECVFMVISQQVQEVYRWYKQGPLTVDRAYQRKLVWKLYEKQYLIDTLWSRNNYFDAIDKIYRITDLYKVRVQRENTREYNDETSDIRIYAWGVFFKKN